VTILVLVILAVIWAAVLLPPYLQNRSEARPADSISTFRLQLDTLERRANLAVPGRPQSVRPISPMPSGRIGMRSVSPMVDRGRLARMDAKRRRRDILVTLLAASGLTLVLGLVLAPVLVLHLVIDVLLVAYVALLLRAKRVAEERAVKVRYIAPARRPAPSQPTLALPRSAAN
jgi:hypothetical protein